MPTQLKKLQIIRVLWSIFAFIWNSKQQKYIINTTIKRKDEKAFPDAETGTFSDKCGEVLYRSAVKSLARPGKKQATATKL